MYHICRNLQLFIKFHLINRSIKYCRYTARTITITAKSFAKYTHYGTTYISYLTKSHSITFHHIIPGPISLQVMTILHNHHPHISRSSYAMLCDAMPVWWRFVYVRCIARVLLAPIHEPLPPPRPWRHVALDLSPSRRLGVNTKQDTKTRQR